MDYPLFYDSLDGDRVYNSDSFAALFRKFFTTGVFSGELKVSPNSGMQINIGAGYCNINGKVMEFAASTLTIPAASASYYQWYNIVVERDDSARNFTIKYVAGSVGSASVAPPAPTRAGSIYQIVLARIFVRPGATQITAADITDTRANGSLCGIVTGTVTQMDFTQFSAQFDSYLSNFKTSRGADFDAWVANIQDILDENTAGNLQNEIENRVEMGTPYLELDTTAASGTVDGDLYAAITARGWESEVIISA